jgi:hypothetical protein
MLVAGGMGPVWEGGPRCVIPTRRGTSDTAHIGPHPTPPAGVVLPEAMVFAPGSRNHGRP